MGDNMISYWLLLGKEVKQRKHERNQEEGGVKRYES
jgi:hypothetical protein